MINKDVKQSEQNQKRAQTLDQESFTQEITIPDVICQTRIWAVKLLTELGFAPKSGDNLAEAKLTIAKQSPKPGEMQKKGTEIVLTAVKLSKSQCKQNNESTISVMGARMSSFFSIRE